MNLRRIVLSSYYLFIIFVFANILIAGDTISLSCSNLYKTGVSVINEDSISRSFYYYGSALSTKICLIKEPTEKIKNGIAPFDFRKELPPGITVTKKNNGNLISMEPNSRLCCLSAHDATIIDKDYGKISVKSGELLIFVNGGVMIEDMDGFRRVGHNE